jgi:predicted glutamine amidotransferase
VDRAGLLPLLNGDWAVTMNGYLPRFRERHMRALRLPLSDARYAELRGSSDAETLFQRVLHRMDGGADPSEALRAVREAVTERMEPGDTAPLTLVLLGGGGITALHTTVNGPVNSLYLGRGTTLAPEGVLLASEPLTSGDRWEPVPPDSLVELRSGAATVVSL